MFGKRLRELRECNGYSMDKLVDLYNKKFNGKMNKSTLSRYENGLQEPMYTVVVNLADLFDVSVDYISGALENETVFMDFYERLRKIRTERGFLSKTMAEKLGVATSSYSQYETGKRMPDISTIKNLAQILDVTGDYLIGLTNDPQGLYGVSTSHRDNLRPDEAALLGSYNKLNDTGKEKAVEYVTDLAGNKKYTTAEGVGRLSS